MQFHQFHILDKSPWPIIISFNLFNLLISSIFFMNSHSTFFLFLNFLLTSFTFFSWTRDIIRESAFQGHHTIFVTQGLKLGMILFIVSEIFFFISFFWTYLNSMLAPDLFIGMIWPPKNISIFNPYQIPLLNTIILLSSGVTITWSHYCLLNNSKNFISSLILTIFLGAYFSILQMMEYNNSTFSMNDSIFGSIFFMGTGFHGIHVLVGTIFILTNLNRYFNMSMNNNHHMNFEFAAWYWHFVDVIWLFLYTIFYWWVW